MAPRGEEDNTSNAFRDVEMATTSTTTTATGTEEIPHMSSNIGDSHPGLSPRRRDRLHPPSSSSDKQQQQHDAHSHLMHPEFKQRDNHHHDHNNNNFVLKNPSKVVQVISVQSKAVTACALYSFCSVAMVLTNKSLASNYNDKAPTDLNILLVVFQAIAAILCVQLSKQMNWVDYPKLTWEVVHMWIPVNLFFCAMLFTGMASLQHNSVPMVTIFKNITNIMVAFGDFFFFNALVETLVIASFAVTLGGAIAAAWNDITSTWTGLFWMAANCCSTAGYVLYMKFATKHVKLSKFGMVYVNNILCVVFLLPAAALRGEVQAFLSTKALHTLDYAGMNSVAGFMGFFLNFAALNCVSATGPTTYAVVGSLNKVPVAFLGYFMFDSAITPQTWFFICVSLCGGFLYSYAKIRQTKHSTQSGSSK